MSVTFTASNAIPNYMRYVYGDISGMVKTARYMDAALLDFALVPADASFINLKRGDYVTVTTDTYHNWFTGFITNEPEPTYLGKSASAEPVFGYKFQATSDEYMLSLKPLGVLQPFLNVPMGQILRFLVQTVSGTFFDITGIEDGPIVAQYVIAPDKLFKDVAKELCEQASYLFYGNAQKLYFTSQDNASLGSVVVDRNNKHFSPSRLSVRPSASPIINDATVLGGIEPQTYMHEYFIGTGLEASFPLTAGVYGADTAILLQDTFSGSDLQSNLWTVCDASGSSPVTALTPVVVQKWGAYSAGSSTTTSAVSPVAVTAGHAIVVALSVKNNVTATVTDSAGNVYTALTQVYDADLNFSLQMFYAIGVAGGTLTVTATSSGTTNRRLYCHEVSNVAAFDAATQAHGSSGSVSSGNVTTSASNDILIALAVNNSGTAGSEASGWTAGLTEGAEGTEYKVQATAASVAATFTADGGPWVCGVVALKAATTGGGGSGIAHTSALLEIFNNALNCLGGPGDGSYSLWVQSASAIPMDGHLRFTHGEFDFLQGGDGYIGSLWTQEPNAARTGLLYGLSVSGYTISPVVNGTVDSTQFVNVVPSMRYIIRTLVEFSKAVRTPNKYTYLDSNGIVQTVTSTVGQDDTATWQTLISEVDPNTGTLSHHWAFKNTSTLSGSVEGSDTDAYAIYTPLVSDSLHFTLGNVSISLPIYATLESASAVALVNPGFDDWLNTTTPSGWINGTGVTQETLLGSSGNAIKFAAGGGSIQQDVSQLLSPNVSYNVVFQLAHLIGSADGTLTMTISGTGMTSQSYSLNTATVTYDGWYQTITGRLLNGIPAIPSDAKLTISYAGGTQPMWLDSLTMLSEYQNQLVGPNELDAMDGLAPVATISSGNMNSSTKSTYTGTPQYNPGQDHLVFFKNSVTLTSNVPPENQIIRLSYRAAGPASGRVVDHTSVTSEASLWSDNGHRSVVRKDLNPRPRTSYECELAAQAIVRENSFQHYEGTYTQFNWYFTDEPKAGMPIKFQNLSGIPLLKAEEINEVQTTILSESPVELFQHRISFGKPDHIRRLLSKLQSPIDVYQSSTSYDQINAVDVDAIGTNFGPDVVKPVLRNWDERYIYMDAGRDLDPAHYFEIRYTDSGWGNDSGKNLVARTTSRYFSVPRTARGRVFFIRDWDGAVYSRYSACVNVAFPVVVSNTYIRDWSCRTIDTASPLVTGSDLSMNRFRVDVDFGEQVRLDSWAATVKTKPTSGPLEFDLLSSDDHGTTFVSLFPTTQRPKVPQNTITATGSAFQTRFLQHGDFLRYDCLQADGIGGGVEIVVKGRVFTIGDSPIGVYSGSGTGNLGAPTGTVTVAGSVTAGIAAEYLMTEGGGTTVHDTSQLVRDGFFYLEYPSWDGSYTALDLPGTVLLPNNTLGVDDSSVTDFTVEAWIKPTDTTGGTFLYFCNGALDLHYNNTSISFASNTAGTVSSSWSSPTSAFHQVVVTRAGTTLKLYLNGTLAATATGGSKPLLLGVADAKFLGAAPFTGTAAAKLGEVRLYARGLAASEVSANWAGRRGNYGV